jgi:primosomal protein N' (replication factor Y)
VESELEQREALGYPPYGKLVLLSVGGYDAEEVEEVAERLTAYLRGALDVPEDGDGEEAGIDILGPAPAPIMRVAKRYRWQVLLKFDRGCEVTLPDIDELRRQCPATVSLTVDVDPMNLG